MLLMFHQSLIVMFVCNFFVIKLEIVLIFSKMSRKDRAFYFFKIAKGIANLLQSVYKLI